MQISPGMHNIVEPVATVKQPDGKLVDIAMMQRWPVRRQRPFKEKLTPNSPMVTRAACHRPFVPHFQRWHPRPFRAPFGSGKTVVQHQLAKWGRRGHCGLHRLR